jgi:hypothetical protein
MRFKNLENFPKAIQRAILNDPYTMGSADISVTKLIDAPQVRKLRAQHAADIEVDARRMLPSLIGKAFHSLMEQHGADEGTIVEERLFWTVQGKILSGAMDLQTLTDKPGAVDILDYKTWKVSQLGFDKPETEAQLNVYAYLCRKHGKKVRSLTAIAILKDWHEASADRDRQYPQSPVIMIPLPLWSEKQAEDYVERRMALHFADTTPPCSDHERWLHGSKWAVFKKDGKRATSVFSSETEALALSMATPNSYIEARPGMAIRCTRNYCDVAKFCPQFQAEKEEKKNAGIIE